MPSNDGADGSVKFGALPSLRNSPDPISKKAKKHQGFPGSGTARWRSSRRRRAPSAPPPPPDYDDDDKEEKEEVDDQ